MDVTEGKVIVYSLPFEINEHEHKVMFNSKNEKDAYLKNERQFCFKEYSDYTGAMNVETRKTLKIELEKKRMAFAVHSGFKELRKTGIWNHIKDDAEKILA